MRHLAFAPRRRFVPEVDPSPHALTAEEVTHIEDRLDAGASPAASVIRKLVRLADERLRVVNWYAERTGLKP